MRLMMQDFFFVHVVVGFRQDGIDVVGGQRGQGKPEGNTDVCEAEAFMQLCMNGFRFFLILHGLDHEEFVAAHAEDGIGGAGLAEDGGRGLDEAVAGLVTELVVRLLETVEVAEEKGILAVRRQLRECKIVCVNRYCMNLLYAPYWGKQR